MSTGIPRDLSRIDFKSEKVRDIPEWADQPKPWRQFKERKLMKSGELHLMYHYGRTLGPGNYADVGVYRGASTAAIAHGIKDSGYPSVVYAVDLFAGVSDSANDCPNQDTPEILRDYFTSKLLDVGLILCKGDSVEWGTHMTQPFRFVFIDADHSYEGCKADYEVWSRWVQPGGVLAFHDTDLDTVDQVVRELPSCWKLDRHVFTTKAFRRV